MPHSHAIDGTTAPEASDTPRRSIDELMQELRHRGHRATTARRAVLEELLAAGDTHLSAEELAARVGAAHPSIHLSTIYRTLDALDEAGLISPARIDGHSATYHLTDDVHHHAVCSNCGRTLSLPASLLEPLSARILDEFDFHADPRHLTIRGLCSDCAAT